MDKPTSMFLIYKHLNPCKINFKSLSEETRTGRRIYRLKFSQSKNDFF